MTKHTTYPVPDEVLAKIAELEQKYGMTTAEFKALERTTSDIEWTYDLHWWHCWMYEIMPGNRCYHPDTPMMRELWALMEERGDELLHPPIKFEFKPEFLAMTKEEQIAFLTGKPLTEDETPAVLKVKKRKYTRRPKVNDAPPIPFID